jgi:vacuolar-type H+-ATPase subunit I/STV1
MKQKFYDMLDECIEEALLEGRGRPKKGDSSAIEDEFKAAKKDEKALNKLIMKYGEHDEDDIKSFKAELKASQNNPKQTQALKKKIKSLEDKIKIFNVVKKHMKYAATKAEDFISRPGATERETTE